VGGVVVGGDDLAAGRVDLFERVRDVDLVDLGRQVQAPVVVVEAEDRRAAGGVVAADALEHRRAVVQRVRHDVGGRLGPGLDRAVLPDPLRVLHGTPRYV